MTNKFDYSDYIVFVESNNEYTGLHKREKEEKSISFPYYLEMKVDKTEEKAKTFYLIEESSGGNYLGDTATTETIQKPSEINIAIERVLEDIITEPLDFLKYKKLLKKLPIKTEEICDREYYGNYTLYESREVKISEIEDALKELDIKHDMSKLESVEIPEKKPRKKPRRT